MALIIGLLIIAIGAFCQSSSYVPINKIKDWSWESYWIIQGVFAWLLFPFIGSLLSVSGTGGGFGDLLSLINSHPKDAWMTILFGVLWGVGGLTFGLSMRYLGVALGQSIALGTCSGLGAILGPVFTGHASDLTTAVIVGVVVTLIGIAIIGVAGAMKSAALPEEEKKKAVKDFNFGKGIAVALLAGFMSACFAIGLSFGQDLYLPGTKPIFQTLPATMLVTFGGFLTNAAYCLFQNNKITRKAISGSTTFCSAALPVCSGTANSSDSASERASSRTTLSSSPSAGASSWLSTSHSPMSGASSSRNGRACPRRPSLSWS